MADPKHVELAKKYLSIKSERETAVALRAAGLTDSEIGEAMAAALGERKRRMAYLAVALVALIGLFAYILILPGLIFRETGPPIPSKSFIVEGCRQANTTVLRFYNNGADEIAAGGGRVLAENYSEVARLLLPGLGPGGRAEADAGVALKGPYLIEYAGVIVPFAC